MEGKTKACFSLPLFPRANGFVKLGSFCIHASPGPHSPRFTPKEGL